MEPHQTSSLVNSDICKGCAMCCKQITLWIPDSENLYERLSFILTDVISCEQVDGWVFLTIKSPCKHLEEKEGLYSCNIWDSPKKPLLCRRYPSNQFIDLNHPSIKQKPDYIKQTLEYVGKTCPAVRDKTYQDIVEDQVAYMKQKHELEKWS